MSKPFELARRGAWYPLLVLVKAQYMGEIVEYPVSGNVNNAYQAVRRLADREGFVVKMATTPNSLIVQKELK